MRVLICPMSAAAPTSGPATRARAVALECLDQGVEVAFCVAHDLNWIPVDDVREYPLDVPLPFGLPEVVSSYAYPLAEKLGLMGRVPVQSFEQVLHITGTTSYPYLVRAVGQVADAVSDFKPDVVYSEFSLPAVIAARAIGVPLVCSYSYPVQPSYASSPQFAGDVNRVLKQVGLDSVTSALELFERADLRVVPSSYDLEPIEGENIVFTGPLGMARKETGASGSNRPRDCVIIYMGTGTIGSRKLLQVVEGAFTRDAPPIRGLAGAYVEAVYIACSALPESHRGMLHVGHHFDFDTLLPRAVAFVNHGGQNSVMDGLLYGVPQLMNPGRVFERRYNAESITVNGAGIMLEGERFRAREMREAIEHMAIDPSYGRNATRLAGSLRGLGGAKAEVDAIRTMMERP